MIASVPAHCIPLTFLFLLVLGIGCFFIVTLNKIILYVHGVLQKYELFLLTKRARTYNAIKHGAICLVTMTR